MLVHACSDWFGQRLRSSPCEAGWFQLSARRLCARAQAAQLQRHQQAQCQLYGHLPQAPRFPAEAMHRYERVSERVPRETARPRQIVWRCARRGSEGSYLWRPAHRYMCHPKSRPRPERCKVIPWPVLVRAIGTIGRQRGHNKLWVARLQLILGQSQPLQCDRTKIAQEYVRLLQERVQCIQPRCTLQVKDNGLLSSVVRTECCARHNACCIAAWRLHLHNRCAPVAEHTPARWSSHHCRDFHHSNPM